MILSGLFGNDTAAKVLLYLECYRQGYPRGIADVFELSISQVQRQLERFELEGVLSSQMVGRTRLYQWNPRCFYLPELQTLLMKARERLPQATQEKYFTDRSRPRRKGKPLP